MTIKRKYEHTPEQQTLFTGGIGSTQDIRTWQDITDTPAGRLETLVGNNVGPHSSVVERAERIIGILDKVSSRNRLNGLNYAVRRREHKIPIWKRYLDGTPQVISNSKNKVERLSDEITIGLVALSGFDRLKGAGLLKRGEVLARIEKNDRDFESQFGPTYRISTARREYRQVQIGFLPEDHPLRMSSAEIEQESDPEEIAA